MADFVGEMELCLTVLILMKGFVCNKLKKMFRIKQTCSSLLLGLGTHVPRRKSPICVLNNLGISC